MGASGTASKAGQQNYYTVKYVPYLSEYVCQKSVNDCLKGVNIVD